MNELGEREGGGFCMHIHHTIGHQQFSIARKRPSTAVHNWFKVLPYIHTSIHPYIHTSIHP
ncbi:hypothetical protein B0T26DRAFT_720316, partial [Lasiosphaeria miniovina]